MCLDLQPRSLKKRKLGSLQPPELEQGWAHIIRVRAGFGTSTLDCFQEPWIFGLRAFLDCYMDPLGESARKSKKCFRRDIDIHWLEGAA